MKKFLAMIISVVMMLGVLAGCYNDYRLKEFDIEVGDEITFGKYQDEKIEWEVLSRHFLPNEGKVRVQLLSKYALDCKPFDEDGVSSWDECSLRQWLNNDFYNEAFSKKEQKQIVDTTYFNYIGDSRYLTDKVYLMSLLWYRFRPEEAICKPSDYAEDQGIAMEDNVCKYWGRDVLESVYAGVGGEDGGTRKFPLVFGFNGNVGGSAFTAEDIGVRPVINVEYKAPYTMKDIEEGDIITFGKYDEAPIEWIVADTSSKGLMLFSRYGLDEMRMDKKVVDEFEDTELYEWLNNDFKNEAFSKKEQKNMVDFGKDEYVTLIEKDETVDYLKDIKYELFTSFTPAYFESHKADDDNVFDTFWINYVDADNENKTYAAFNPNQMFQYAKAGDKYSVRPIIKIKF